MEYENYMELYEAIYFFNRIYGCIDNKSPKLKYNEEIKRLGINESTYKAMIRILVVNDLLDYEGYCYKITNENKEKYQYILENIINKNKDNRYTQLFEKAINKFQFFFDMISESEYEIYSRYNFEITFKTGKKVVKHVDLDNKKVLELGRNSGGLGTAILTQYKDCIYTIVDTKIPCMVGYEINKSNNLNITFIEGNIFELSLSNKLYDYIIIMNLLHDYDDVKCIDILNNCIKHCNSRTKFLIIEDALMGEFEPKEAIMHGLRLSAECRGGKQRTIQELVNLFLNINYKLDKTVKLDTLHSMLVMGLCDD